MSLLDFIFNGGLMGMMDGYDYKREGHIYGWNEFDRDTARLDHSMKQVGSCVNSGRNMLPHNYMDDDLKGLRG